MSHANRSKKNPTLGQTPTSSQVLAAREAAGLTQTAAGELIYSTLRAWQNYEMEEGYERHRRMHPQLFEAFLIKTGKMPKAFYEALIAKAEAKNEEK